MYPVRISLSFFFNLKIHYFILMDVLLICMPAYHMYAWYRGDQKRVLDSSKLELQVLVSTMWVLGLETRSSGRAVSSLNH